MTILIIVLIFIIVFFICTSRRLLSHSKHIKNRISFEEFKNYYSLKPEHWKLKEWFVVFYKDSWTYTCFRFNLIDTWKYSWFLAGEEAKEKETEKIKEKAAANSAYNQMKEIMDTYKEET